MPRIISGYKEEVKKKVIEAAYHQFLLKGYHGTTMDDIAKVLGVTKPALYQYFPGKEDLYAAVAEYSRQELKGILERSFKNRDLRGGSEALFETLCVYAPQFHGMFAEMMLLAPRNDRIRQIIEEDFREDMRVIEQFIRSQQETGYLSPGHDARVLAVASYAVINGLLIDIAAGMDKNEARKVWVITVEALLRPG